MTAASPPTAGAARSLGRFLEIQTLGLNLSFALAFLLLASNGRPSWWALLWVVVAFVAARNAGHSFNRWADRRLDAANPRTQQRALVTGRYSPTFALSFCAANAALLVLAAYLLNPLAFVLAPVALVIVLGYSYTKRVTSFTTAFLGLVQAVTPAAVYIAITGTLPLEVLLAVSALLAWGTAFETIHSLGDVESDRALGLFSVPVRFGIPASVRLVPTLHAIALALFVAFGLALHLTSAYFLALVAMAVLVVVTDRDLAKNPTAAKVPFERHFAMSLFYLVGVAIAVYIPLGPAWVF
ncbi:MAG TPA: 4-hydroxybenzoate octaprenyltransferase [Thermoplasmata archaeon]|nr:4-hydroxybenzoate octaprenyltransferase [Thermoplasmata archaeon]